MSLVRSFRRGGVLVDRCRSEKDQKNKKDKSSKPTLLVSRRDIEREIVAHHPLFLAISRTLRVESLVDSPHCLENLG